MEQHGSLYKHMQSFVHRSLQFNPQSNWSHILESDITIQVWYIDIYIIDKIYSAFLETTEEW